MPDPLPQSPLPVVLVVEDEPELLHLTQGHLTRRGCRVVGATSAEVALVHFREQPIDLVFTDLRLGGMGGDGLIARVIAARPDVQVVATSALMDELDRVQDQWGRRVRYLLKPYRSADLDAMVAVEVGAIGAAVPVR